MLYTDGGQGKIIGNIRWLKEKGHINQRAKISCWYSWYIWTRGLKWKEESQNPGLAKFRRKQKSLSLFLGKIIFYTEK